MYMVVCGWRWEKRQGKHTNVSNKRLRRMLQERYAYSFKELQRRKCQPVPIQCL